MIKERPILFNGAMVRAILDGTKTQTRRVTKFGVQEFVDEGSDLNLHVWRTDEAGDHHLKDCPYGMPGDQLWVRETHSRLIDGTSPAHVRYKAHYPTSPWGTGWKPSIHMPRWASRITLKIKGVRVERVQDITEEDAKAEGLIDDFISPGDGHSALYHFVTLWNSINIKRGYGWSTNPWVWVVDFEVEGER